MLLMSVSELGLGIGCWLSTWVKGLEWVKLALLI